MQFNMNTATSSGNNISFIPTAQFLESIKFQTLPFYNVLTVIMKPTPLIDQERYSLQVIPKGKMLFVISIFYKLVNSKMLILFLGLRVRMYELRLSKKKLSIITENCNFFSSEEKYLSDMYQIQIRISVLDGTVTTVTDFLPNGLTIRINGKECPLPQDNKSPIINCTKFFKLNPTVLNQINIKWISSEKNYVMAIYIVKQLSVDNLLDALKYKRTRSFEESVNIIKRHAIGKCNLLSSVRVSLVCPLSLTRIKIPVKSINCYHLECFDAIVYILMNEKNPTWLCPICEESCLYDDLLIDAFLLKIIKNVSLERFNKIELLPSGMWRLYNEGPTLNDSDDTDESEN